MARLPPSDEPSTKPKTASGAATGETCSVENEKLQLRRPYHLATHNTGSKGKRLESPEEIHVPEGNKNNAGFYQRALRSAGDPQAGAHKVGTERRSFFDMQQA